MKRRSVHNLIHQHSPSRPIRKSALCVLLLLASTIALAPRNTLAQSHWDLTPYQIEVQVAIDPSPQIPESMATDLLSTLQEKVESVIGPLWSASFERVPVDSIDQVFQQADPAFDKLVSIKQLQNDKVFFLLVRAEPDGFRILGREFDCHTRRWGIQVRDNVRQSAMLNDSLFRALTRAFSPIAQIAFDKEKQPFLKPRARMIAPAADDFQLFQPGDISLPVFRRNDKEGQPRKEHGIQIPPRVYLEIDKPSPDGTIQCKTLSGNRNTLRARRRGRIELYGLTIRPPEAPTQLFLHSRYDVNEPLPGYEVFIKDLETDEFELLGVTDANGKLEVESTDDPVRFLYVRSGGRLLGKFPILPGLTEETPAPIANDHNRLKAEGELRGVETEFLDLVVQRQVLIARVKSRIKAGNPQDAVELLEQLESLPTRERFISKVDQIETQISSKDPMEKRLIKDMFKKSRRRLAAFLDSREIERLRTELYQAMQSNKTETQPPKA